MATTPRQAASIKRAKARTDRLPSDGRWWGAFFLYFSFTIGSGRMTRAFPEKAELGDSHRRANMIQASCWKEASMDGEAAFGGFA